MPQIIKKSKNVSMQDEGLYTAIRKSLFKLTGSLISIFWPWLLLIFQSNSICIFQLTLTIRNFAEHFVRIQIRGRSVEVFLSCKQGVSFKKLLQPTTTSTSALAL